MKFLRKLQFCLLLAVLALSSLIANLFEIERETERESISRHINQGEGAVHGVVSLGMHQALVKS